MVLSVPVWYCQPWCGIVSPVVVLSVLMWYAYGQFDVLPVKYSDLIFVRIKDNKDSLFFPRSIIYIRVLKTFPRLLYLDERFENCR